MFGKKQPKQFQFPPELVGFQASYAQAFKDGKDVIVVMHLSVHGPYGITGVARTPMTPDQGNALLDDVKAFIAAWTRNRK